MASIRTSHTHTISQAQSYFLCNNSRDTRVENYLGTHTGDMLFP